MIANDVRPDWYDTAACRGKTELFFPNGHYERAHARIQRENQARAICTTCPALIACRRWAREHREIGVWGAETDEQRIAAGYPSGAVGGDVVRRARTG